MSATSVCTRRRGVGLGFECDEVDRRRRRFVREAGRRQLLPRRRGNPMHAERHVSSVNARASENAAIAAGPEWCGNRPDVASVHARDPEDRVGRRPRHRARERVAGPPACRLQGGRAPARPPQGQEHEVRRRRVLVRGGGRERRRNVVRLVADRRPPVPAHTPLGRGGLPARRDHGQPDHDGRHAQGLLGPEGPARRHGRQPCRRLARVPELPAVLRADVRGAQRQDARRPLREGLQRLDDRRVVCRIPTAA